MLFPGCGEFNSFERQLEMQQIMVDDYELYGDSGWWRQSWFPLFSMGSTCSLVVECGVDHPQRGSIWASYLDSTTSEYVANSLDAFLGVLRSLFEEGAFAYRDGRLVPALETDRDVVAIVLSRLRSK